MDGSEWALVGGDDLGDAAYDGVGVIRSAVAAGDQDVGVEVERGGAPDVSPARGQHGGAAGLLHGELGDDLALDDFGEGADVDAPAAVVGGGLEISRQREDASGGDWPRWSREAAEDAADEDVHGVEGEVRPSERRPTA